LFLTLSVTRKAYQRVGKKIFKNMEKAFLVLSMFVLAFIVNATDGIDIYSTSSGYDKTFAFTTAEDVTISINFYNSGVSTIATVCAEGESNTIYALQGIVKDAENSSGTDALFSIITNVSPLNTDLVAGTTFESEWWDFTSNYGDQTFEIKIYDNSSTLIFDCYVDFINEYNGTPNLTRVAWYRSN
jgi:hypothetical protein